jgi:hypothetical protein
VTSGLYPSLDRHNILADFGRSLIFITKIFITKADGSATGFMSERTVLPAHTGTATKKQADSAALGSALAG